MSVKNNFEGKYDEKLNKIFKFLSENRQFNHALQNRFYISVIMPHNTISEKITALLYHVANTQSQPKIDRLASFFKSINNDLKCLNSMKSFIEMINPNKPLNFLSLYNGMKEQAGWGHKTAALLTKSIFHLHNGKYDASLKIWKDVPETITENENFFLPVDTVIIAIFNKIDANKKWTFDNINSLLSNNYTGQQIEVWDDLWFWGFVTQRGTGNNRVLGWNENKYWALKDSDKDSKTIKSVKEKASEFLKILNQ